LSHGGYYGHNDVLDTCFVLLFLKRANLAEDLTEKLQMLAALPPPVAAPGRKE
jgi:hypothetical protein